MKIGVIGLGSIGMRHLKNLVDMGHEVFGYDNDPLGKEIPSVAWKDDYAEKLGAIVIASPTDKHWDHLRMASLANKPIFMEKPISHVIETDGEFIEEFTHSVVMVGYNLRFHPCVIKAKEWIDAGDIGEPVWANFTLGQRSEKPPYLRDGVILNWSHEIDLCLYLLGRGSVSGSSTRLSDGRDDISDILFTHTNGCRSAIHLDYTTQPEVRQSIIVGSKAAVILDLVNHQGWLRDKDGVILENVDAPGGWNHTYIQEMAAFLSRLENAEVAGATAEAVRGATAEEALEVLKICLEVRKQAGL